MIEITDSTKWVIATNATTVFTNPEELDASEQFTTGQPYICSGDTEQEVLNKVVTNPQNYDPTVGIGVLTKRSGTTIVNNADLVLGADVPFDGRVFCGVNPPYLGEDFPFVLFLHGGTGNGIDFRTSVNVGSVFGSDITRFFPTATLNGSGLTAWNSGGPFNPGVDDVGWLNGFVDYLELIEAIDLSKVFIMGHSNGAMMGYRLLIENPGRFAGLVSVSGDVMVANPDTYTGKILHIHGALDTNVPLAGGIGENGVDYPPVQPAVEAFTNADVTFEILTGAAHSMASIKSAIVSEQGTTLAQKIYNFVME